MLTNPNESLLYNIALSLIPQIGPGVFKTIISYSGSAENFFTMPNRNAGKIPGIGPRLMELRQKKKEYLLEADRIIQDSLKYNVQIHHYLDDSYPDRLKSFSDSPVILFTKGKINLNPDRTIGIVGTRNATSYGKNITSKIVEDLAFYNPTIISGLAYGIDIEAHRAALKCHLPTIGILGSPLNKVYPSAHSAIAETMMENGGLITEYKIGSTLNPSNFPQRNRIIAALSDALIVVEAAQKGGALITAEIAYSYNKEIFAVPGNLQSTFSEGCNNLIRTMKAGIYMGPKEIEDALSWNREISLQNQKPQVLDLSQFDQAEQAILQVLIKSTEIEIDKLSWESQIPISSLAAKLLALEFQGLVKSLPGKKYKWLGSGKK